MATLYVPSPSYAELQPHEIKAAYLYQISKFVYWPQGKLGSETFEICQMNEDSFKGKLNQIIGRKIYGKPVKISIVDGLDNATTCQVLVISSPGKILQEELVRWLKQHSVLTIVDNVEYIKKGMVAFAVENQRIRLHINLNLAERANLAFAANLLEIASRVYRDLPQ